jgi:hypothetical protein
MPEGENTGMIFLRDHHFRQADSLDFSTTWRTHLEKCFLLSHEGAIRSDILNRDKETDAFLATDAVVFLHSFDGANRSDWIKWFSEESGRFPKGHLVIVSTEGGIIVEETPRIHGCYWRPGAFLPTSGNEAALEFANDLRAGIFRPELLKPRAIPKYVVAYALAIHYGVRDARLTALRRSADQSYEQLHSQAHSLLSTKKQPLTYERVGLPKRELFEPEAAIQNESESLRFKAMRNLIDVLREDL